MNLDSAIAAMRLEMEQAAVDVRDCQWAAKVTRDNCFAIAERYLRELGKDRCALDDMENCAKSRKGSDGH